MSAAEQTRIASLEASLRIANKRIEEMGYRIEAMIESEKAKLAGTELVIQRLEQEIDALKRRRSKLILEMCDMEERNIEQAKEIKDLRAQVKWFVRPRKPSSVA